MNWTKSLIRLAITVAACLLAVSQLNAQMLTISEQEQNLLGIKTQAINAIDQGSAGEITMRVAFAADAEWAIKTPLSGVLQRVYVQQGDKVKQGDALVVVRSAQMVALQRDYLKARAELNLQESNWKRDQQLGEAGSISERRWQETRFSYETARAEFAGLRGELMLAGFSENDLKQLVRNMEVGPDIVLRAPADSVVLDKPAMLGDQLAGSELLLRLGDTRKLVLEGDLSSSAAANLSIGNQLALKGIGTRAELTLVSSILDPQSQTVHVRAVPVDGSILLPGQLGTWEILSGGSLLTLPSSAVVKLDGKDVVYIKVRGGFEVREVEVNSTGSGAWLVRNGLKSGDTIAIIGTAALKGMSMGLGGGED